jgi:ABC-type antimicrobial peptide transport system permease subunit
MSFMLYGLSPPDPRAWIGASALMFAAGLGASVIPARRASRIDPMIAMQVE